MPRKCIRFYTDIFYCTIFKHHVVYLSLFGAAFNTVTADFLGLFFRIYSPGTNLRKKYNLCNFLYNRHLAVSV